MPVSANAVNNTAPSAPDNIYALLTLVEDPKAFKAKLNEFNAAKAAADAAIAKAELRIAQTGIAAEIDADRAKAKADKQVAAKLLADAQVQAQAIVNGATNHAQELGKMAQEQANALAVQKATHEENVAKHKAELDARSNQIDGAIAKALAERDNLLAQIALTKKAQEDAAAATIAAQSCMQLINTQFQAFIDKVKPSVQSS